MKAKTFTNINFKESRQSARGLPAFVVSRKPPAKRVVPERLFSVDSAHSQYQFLNLVFLTLRCPLCENPHDGQIFHSAGAFLATLNFTS